MIERICILCLITIIKSEVWTITHCLELGHETMVSAVCLSIFLCLWTHSICYRYVVSSFRQSLFPEFQQQPQYEYAKDHYSDLHLTFDQTKLSYLFYLFWKCHILDSLSLACSITLSYTLYVYASLFFSFLTGIGLHGMGVVLWDKIRPPVLLLLAYCWLPKYFLWLYIDSSHTIQIDFIGIGTFIWFPCVNSIERYGFLTR